MDEGRQGRAQISAEPGAGGGLGIDTMDDRKCYVWDADTEWHHLAATLPEGGATSADFLIYFDGVLQEETVHFLGEDAFNTVGGEVTIGCWTGGPINWFNGIIDDVAMFPYEMPAEDIANIARRGLKKGQTMDVSPRSKLATSWGAIKERQ